MVYEEICERIENEIHTHIHIYIDTYICSVYFQNGSCVNVKLNKDNVI